MIQNLLTEAVDAWSKEIKETESALEWVSDNTNAHKSLTEKIVNKKKLIEEAEKLIEKH